MHVYTVKSRGQFCGFRGICISVHQLHQHMHWQYCHATKRIQTRSHGWTVRYMPCYMHAPLHSPLVMQIETKRPDMICVDTSWKPRGSTGWSWKDTTTTGTVSSVSLKRHTSSVENWQTLQECESNDNLTKEQLLSTGQQSTESLASCCWLSLTWKIAILYIHNQYNTTSYNINMLILHTL